MCVSVHGAEIHSPTVFSALFLSISLLMLFSVLFSILYPSWKYDWLEIFLFRHWSHCWKLKEWFKASLTVFLFFYLIWCSVLDNILFFTETNLLLKLDLETSNWLLLLLKALHKSGRIWKSTSCQLKIQSKNPLEHRGGCDFSQNEISS